MEFLSNGISGGAFSLASGAIGRFGILGIVTLVAGFLLFGSLKRFASTPKGMLVMAGVLIAALAIPWLSARRGLAGSRGASPASRKKVAHQKPKKDKPQKVNTAHGPMNRPAMAAMMPHPGMGMGAAGMPMLGFGAPGGVPQSAPMVTAPVSSLGPMAHATQLSHTAHTAGARHSPAPAPFDPPAMSPRQSAPGAMHPAKQGSGLAQAGQGTQNHPAGNPAAGQSGAQAAAKAPAGKNPHGKQPDHMAHKQASGGMGRGGPHTAGNHGSQARPRGNRNMMPHMPMPRMTGPVMPRMPGPMHGGGFHRHR
jgi:hypothetical protein